MSHVSRLGRLFSLGLTCLWGVSAVLGQLPALTTVSDIVYRADGTPASGTLLISWPAFSTADGHAVAAGTKSVPLASNGGFSVQLAPNAGGTPAVTYAVVYQLSDGTVKSEAWSVGTASPQTVAQVRTLVGTSTTMDAGCSTCTTLGRRGSIHDNLVGDRLNAGSVAGLAGTDGIELLADAGPMTNITISHNTIVSAQRAGMIFGGTSGTGSFTNFVFQNNLFSAGNYGVLSANSGGGCEANNTGDNFYLFLNNCAGTTWTADHNAMFNWVTGNLGGTLGNLWPTDGHGANNFFYIGTAGPGFTNYGTGDSGFNPANYQLTTSSPLHNVASDGKDVGADIPTLLTKIAGVRQ